MSMVMLGWGLHRQENPYLDLDDPLAEATHSRRGSCSAAHIETKPFEGNAHPELHDTERNSHASAEHDTCASFCEVNSCGCM